jgi:hypothetical protein
MGFALPSRIGRAKLASRWHDLQQGVAMRKTWKVGLALLVALGVAQLVRPARVNPPTNPAATLEAHLGAGDGLSAVLERSCDDCHSNRTAWPWYTGIAPLSWVIASGVKTGRQSVNFSEWGGYSPAQRQELLRRSCADATSGKMPGGAWVLLHPEARLSAKDVETICNAARRPELAVAP